MRRLFAIFDATTGYIKPLAAILITVTVIYGICLMTWWYYDFREVEARNKVISQQRVAEVYHDSYVKNPDRETRTAFLLEQQKLIEYKGEYDNLRETWLGGLFLGDRDQVEITVITSSETKAAYGREIR